MENSTESRKIEIGPETLKYLNKTRRWTMFLSIAGFILLGLIVTLGLITGTFLSAFSNSDKIPGLPDILLLAGFLAAGLICFFPVLFLYRFSKHTAAAVSKLDGTELNKAFRYLKHYYVFMGIILIAAIIGYLAGLVISGAAHFSPGG